MIKRLILYFIVMMFFSSCTAIYGSYKYPLLPESIVNNDNNYATVIFFKGYQFSLMNYNLKDNVIFIDYQRKNFYEPSEFMIANSEGFTISKLPEGVHNFSINDNVHITALLKAGQTYFIVSEKRIWKIPHIYFTTKDHFLRYARDRKRIQITYGLDPTVVRSTWEYKLVDIE